MGGQSSKDVDRSEPYDRSYPREESWSHSPSQPSPPPPPPPSSSQGYDPYYAGTYQSPYPAYSPPRAYPPPDYPAQPQPSYQPPADYPAQKQQSNQPPPKNAARPHRGMDRSLTKIADNYSSLEQVTEALARAGLESSNLIVGIDFTKSNEWTGKHSFNGRSLHHIGDIQNPYEQAISVIGRTLSAFDEDNLIPSFGFGDASTHDQDVFSFYPDGRPCHGFPEALSRYREIVPVLRLAGPTSFAPIIEMAMTIVAQSGGQYHVLVIIADGQVTRSVDLEFGQLSTQEQATVDAIVRASEFPLSIVLVGVGDGPWDTMKEFDDNIPVRSFDNFQFVNFTEIMSKNIPHNRKETEFALAALMEIPPQYKATIELGILGRRAVKSPERVPLPPPIGSYGAPSMDSKSFGSSSYQLSTPSYPTYVPPASSAASAPPASGDSWDDQQVCPICLSNPKNMAFGCGHQTCTECGPGLQLCPICRNEIVTRIRLY
ncbi:E3 ubiquitin-protein ligase RGLG2-like isoform X1 [Iris pallida]|uniref:E3 ubiquitin-protein ligase RGLG2-like isoform X1 n=1 Tax=Iris pallida TaxID=29817 RepID=A0AAX6FYJ5_IRIPA|nr:E3 ubiquitin-protein ligase RGLG2-like isoform X1 [Iris pallida]